MIEPVIVALICITLGWGIWKTRNWKPPAGANADLERAKFYGDLTRDIGQGVVRLDRIESDLTNIRSEWDNYRSSVDSIVRRGIRHKVLESQAEETTPEAKEAAPTLERLSRSDLLRIGLGRGNSA